MTAIALPQSDRAIAKAWARHGAALGVLLALTLVVFQDAVSAAAKVWWVSPTYSHCFLIVPIVLWLVWENRPALAATAPALFPPVLLLTPLLGLLWWMGQLAAINEVQQYAIVGTIQVLIVALLAWGIRLWQQGGATTGDVVLICTAEPLQIDLDALAERMAPIDHHLVKPVDPQHLAYLLAQPSTARPG